MPEYLFLISDHQELNLDLIALTFFIIIPLDSNLNLAYHIEIIDWSSIMKCINCQNETSNPKFCSRSCSVTLNNKLSPKREWTCRRCRETKPRPSPQAIFCSDCKKPRHGSYHIPDSTTLAEIRLHYKERKFGPVNTYTLIRSRARSLYRRNGKQTCAVCPYDRHYEVAHVKAISDWNDTSTLAEINSLSNLVALCPTHHWEFDNLSEEERGWKL